MKVLEIMERTGMVDLQKALAYIADGLSEMGDLIQEKTTGTSYDVVADQKLYTFPSNMIRLLGVYRKYDTDSSTSRVRYIRIGRIQAIDTVDQVLGASTSVSSEDDILVI
jgi:hypothetical protein